MDIKSLKHNFIMYFIRTFFNLGFGIIIFPFVTRKLGAENLGKIQYVEAVVAYFILFINLGIDTYGKREVALYRYDKEKLSKIVLELLCILFMSTILGTIIYIFFINYCIQEIVTKKIFITYIIYILFNFFNIEWFYIGIENQSYITKRNILFKIISAILIIIFIKSSKNIYIYTNILIFALVGSNIFNIFNIRKYINIKKIKFRELKKHFKPLFILFFSVLATSISYNLDSIMVKNIVGDKELGYYSFAIKMGKIPLIFATAIVGIFYPRLCNLLGQGKKEEYYKLTIFGIENILLFSIPVSIGMYLLSEIIVKVFAGNEFLPSVSIMKVFSILVIVAGFAFSTGSMTLVVNKKDKIYFLSIIIGAILNFLFNIIFIPKIGALGAAIATLITEITAIIIRVIFCRDIFKNLNIVNINLLKIIIASIFMGVVVTIFKEITSNMIVNLLISIGIGGITYFIFLILLKEKNIVFLFSKIINIYTKKD